MQQEAKEASRNMLTKSFDMEELWFAAVGGRLKAWGAQSHPELKASAPCDGAEGSLLGVPVLAAYILVCCSRSCVPSCSLLALLLLLPWIPTRGRSAEALCTSR
jgi:hypothetical protein